MDLIAPGGSVVNDLTRVTLLLCVRLSLSEYHKLVNWLDERSLPLGSLLSPKGRVALSSFPEAERILSLLRRSSDVDHLLQHWSTMGIWVLAERDPLFPQRLRSRLRSACLPLLFGSGSIELLNLGGLCVVGSRDCGKDALEFATTVGHRAGHENMLVISSDMRGVDRQVLHSTLVGGGRVVCMVCDSLEKAVGSRRYREALATGKACLVTPFTPDTNFAVANAMRANRYQYGLSDAALIVDARHTGGIWSGAEENRKHRWVPAFVRAGSGVSSGNAALLHLGLYPITLDDLKGCHSLAELLIDLVQRPKATVERPSHQTHGDGPLGEAMFHMFVEEIRRLEPEIRNDEEHLAESFALEVQQIRAWLKRVHSQGLMANAATQNATVGPVK
jgi:predicted Rossmann fold nucleotide-binding protein DprA/Smf involved in DNA uptake